MEHLSIKPNGYTDEAKRIQAGSSHGSALAGLATNFKELVSKAGIHIDNRLNLFAARSGIAAIGKTADLVEHDDGHRPDPVRNDHDHTNPLDRSARENYSEDHSSAKPVDRDDDGSRNQSDSGRGQHDSTEDQADSSDTGSRERHASDDGDSGNQVNKNEVAPSDGAEARDNKGNDGQAQDETKSASSNTTNQDGQTVTAGTDGVNAASLAAGERVNIVNADSIFSGNANSTTAASDRINTMVANAMVGGSANPDTAAEGDVNAKNTNTMSGSNSNLASASGNLVNAINADSNIGSNANHSAVAMGLDTAKNANSTASVTDKVNAAGRLDRAAVAMNDMDETGFNSLAATAGKRESLHSNQGTGNGGGQQGQEYVNLTSENPQAQADNTPTSATAAQQQATELNKVIGPGDRVLVDVNITRDADAISSKPSSSLTMNTLLADAGKGQSQSGQQGLSAQNHSGQVAHMVAGGQAQAQAAQQSAQNQATLQAATDARGSTSVNAATNNASSTAHAGGESAAPTAGTGTQQAQQSTQAQANAAQAQANSANKPILPGHSVVDQVSIKITKALQAGNDRITVQLRPADLGRVEVKMELTHDGRVMAVVTADNKDTLDLLRRDSAELQKSLQDAGMALNSGDLTFNLRGQEGETAEGNKSNTVVLADDELAEDGSDETAVDNSVAVNEVGMLANGRIDVRA